MELVWGGGNEVSCWMDGWIDVCMCDQDRNLPVSSPRPVFGAVKLEEGGCVCVVSTLTVGRGCSARALCGGKVRCLIAREVLLLSTMMEKDGCV